MTDRAGPQAPAIYLDHHATTPVDARVATLMVDAMTTHFGNANSRDHIYGDTAASLIETARRHVAGLVDAEPGDVVFTPAASDALRLALAHAVADRAGPLRVALMPIEHPALLEAVEEAERDGKAAVRWLDVDARGCVSLASISHCLAAGTDLLCLMSANNEVGTVQPIEEAGRLAEAAACEFLVDASQSAHWLPDVAARSSADYLILSAHKMHGPKGVGALVGPDLARRSRPDGWRHHVSTPNSPAIAGMGEACRIARAEAQADRLRIGVLRDHLQALLEDSLPGLAINGDPDMRLPNNLHVSVPDAPNDVVLGHLRHLVAISSGAACQSGSDAPSHVLRAMKLPAWRLEGALRIGLGRFTRADEVGKAAAAIVQAVRAAQFSLRKHA